ncbi:cobalamin-binding protein [Chitiniphilus purpureus]|uniref:Cobalamin-binding protein n=1 Tax=Chitiniphilus purpureus TaxID=2981137 RepID=A0ABY6DHT1_9NEIS|nr:cobalamin-binding protein [Chitiniphilus sp. CD1]UXY13909.1 cobalamin-binding protein [Chitiniphilus sp. CD1]
MKTLLICLFACLPLLTHAGSAVHDDRGRRVALPRPAQRIVSLAPHLTEVLFAIGAGKALVGAVDYSDHPPAALRIPRVGGYHGFDLERIRALKPDLIVGWAGGNPAQQLAQLEALGIPLFLADSKRLRDVPTVFERLGLLTGRGPEAGAAATRFRTQLAALGQRYAARKPVRVFYQVWDRPLLTINRDQIISDAMRLCGGVNVFADLPALVPTVDDEAVLRADPEVIVTSGEPGANGDWLARWRRWPALQAVRHGRLHTVPQDLLSRMGPRLVDGTALLCQAIDSARR